MKPWTLILILIAAIVVLVATRSCMPQDFADAANRQLLAQPTATAAAIKNEEAAIYVTVVAPARAAADAKSIVARTEQQIAEDKHQQELRHVGEMAAITVSNTQQINTINAQYTAEVEGIKANGVKEAMDATASAEERAAQARMETGLSLGVMLFLIITGVGGAFALNKALDNRATIIDRTPDGSIKAIVKHGQIIYDSALGHGPVTAATGPDRLERLLLLFAMWQQMNRAGANTSPWQVYREYRQITAPSLAHPLPASEETALQIALGAQQARVDALAALRKQPTRPTRDQKGQAAAESMEPPIPGGSIGLRMYPALPQPLPRLEILDVIDMETMRTLEVVTSQA